MTEALRGVGGNLKKNIPAYIRMLAILYSNINISTHRNVQYSVKCDLAIIIFLTLGFVGEVGCDELNGGPVGRVLQNGPTPGEVKQRVDADLVLGVGVWGTLIVDVVKLHELRRN